MLKPYWVIQNDLAYLKGKLSAQTIGTPSLEDFKTLLTALDETLEYLSHLGTPACN